MTLVVINVGRKSGSDTVRRKVIVPGDVFKVEAISEIKF